MAEPLATLGARLREVRELAGLTPGQVARFLNCEIARVVGHEAGETTPDDVELARLAKLYDVTVAALRDGVAPATVDELRLPPEQRAKFDRLSDHDRAEILRVATWLKGR